MSENTRDKLIAISIEVMAIKGFNNTGIAEILAVAKVPKGSFYHYFKSKDDLGLAIIEHYGQQLRAGLNDHLATAEGSSLIRLRGYFETILTYFESKVGSCNCLLGNLGQELSMQNAVMRDAIFVHYRALENVIADCLRQAKAEGELASHQDEQMLAKIYFASWEGCLVRARLEQSEQPLRDLIYLYFSVVFKS
ncbi:MAG: TetR family transcriptional regulator C-terminal domain-containing protein [Marinagarivorans sp.]|nr:TetR family transcriptional regulator C-terminal domain-containing protein [Marinagarivorans sp.]